MTSMTLPFILYEIDVMQLAVSGEKSRQYFPLVVVFFLFWWRLSKC